MPTHPAHTQAVRLLSREVGHPTTPDAYRTALTGAVAVLRGLTECTGDWDTTGHPGGVQAVKAALLDAFLAVVGEAADGLRAACAPPATPSPSVPLPRMAPAEVTR